MIKNFIYMLKQVIYDLYDNSILLGLPLIIGWSILHRLKFRLGIKVQDLKGQLKYNIDKIDSDKIYWTNPQRIQYYQINKDKKWRFTSKITKEIWNRSKQPIKDLTIYKALIERFNYGKKWQDTKFYQEVINDMNNGEERWNCRSKEDLDRSLNSIEALYNEIKISNYKPENELLFSKELFVKFEVPQFFGNIIVNIGKDGELLLLEGKLMLTLAKFLDITEIPFIIKTRHKKWIRFKKELSYLSRRGPLYQQCTHPDLQEFPFFYGHERFNMIKENLSISKGNVLDIGANLGYFCRKFEELGFNCYAVEANMYYFYFLKKLKKAENKKFKIIPVSIFNYRKKQQIKFDVILALFIFHHFLKRRNTFFNLVKLLNRIKVKELFFGAHNPKSFQYKKVYKNFTPDQFVNFILENSCLNKAKLIGKTKTDRYLYKLTSENSSF